MRCERDGSNVRIEVADTGIGIPPSEHERVFEEFYQIGNPERDRRKGLGLGLATVRRITQLLETSISFQSEPGRGSIFRIDVRAGDAAQIAAATAEPPGVDLGVLAGRHILVIEDDASVREALTQLLGEWKCEVLAVSGAAEAIARLNHAPQGIVTDFRLRDHETGIAAIAVLRQHFGHAIPAILVTGDSAPEVFAAAREHHVPILTKPVRAARLRAALTSLLIPARHENVL